MDDTIAKPLDARELRGATLCQTLHWLACGRIDAAHLSQVYLDAIAARNPTLNAYISLSDTVKTEAAAADARRARGNFARLDGVPVSIKDNIDVAGLPTSGGLPGKPDVAMKDAHVVERLRGAGAIVLGKTQLSEARLGASSENRHGGDVHNPFRPGIQAGGSSAGAAASVAAGLCAAAIGTDSLGSIRIPASYCGVFALKPTHGEISARGMLPAARRLDAIGLIGRSVDDLGVLLHVLAGYDADDPRSRQRRRELALPDWEPGKIRVGTLADLHAFGTQAAVIESFAHAQKVLAQELGQSRIVDFSDFDLARARRAAFFLIEAEMLVTHSAALTDAHSITPQLRKMLDYARGKSAADYVAADRWLDAATQKARRLFAEIDVLVSPTTPQAAFALGSPPPDNQADFTCFANLAGCPAVTMPMGLDPDGMPLGLQFMGPPGSDLRLLELAEVCAAALDATPNYPIDAA